MTIVGRTTKDALVKDLNDGRKVVHFSLAVNDYYRTKGGEGTKLTTFFNCSYWVSEKVAEHLKKGTLVEVSGRVYATAYQDMEGTAKASLNCHVAAIKIHAWPKEILAMDQDAGQPAPEPFGEDDLPF